jgi:uncharacterized protein (TIGR04255 family)
MLFPESERVVYETNQLEQVICEVRYPEILRIDSEAPAGFQDRIRGEYPLFEKGSALKLELPPEIARILPLEVNFSGGPVVYNFISPDKRWKVGLTAASLTLSTGAYERWEDFRGHLASPLAALEHEYRPAFFSRIGLRYRNVIRPSTLDLDDSTLSSLLKRHIAGVLADPEVSRSIESATQQLVFQLPDEAGRTRLTHGLATHNKTGEKCYIIDNDLFTEARVEVKDAVQKLSLFNTVAARIFRWCIADRLHLAMRPHKLPD